MKKIKDRWHRLVQFLKLHWRTTLSLAHWRYRRTKAKKNPVMAMSRSQAERLGFIDKAADAHHFNSMDAWPVATDTVETFGDARERALEQARTELGAGKDVNSIAWQEVLNRWNNPAR